VLGLGFNFRQCCCSMATWSFYFTFLNINEFKLFLGPTFPCFNVQPLWSFLVSLFPCFVTTLFHCSFLLLCPCFDVPSCHFKYLYTNLPPYFTTPLFHYSTLGYFLCPNWYSPFWMNVRFSVSISAKITLPISQCMIL